MCGVGFLADIHGRPGRHILPLALEALHRLAHRGAVDADGRTGDGAGVLTQIPRALLGIRADQAAGLVFGGPAGREALAVSLAARGLTLSRWREVPIQESALGPKARSCRPQITQVIVARNADIDDDEFERRLFAARKEAETRAPDLYIASLSHRTIVYKALARAVDLAAFYPDLRQPEFETAFAVFHQRFSTNTIPSWAMTQPFRMLAHNGEINTISGNRNWMAARGLPLRRGVSDSASLDEALSLLTMYGRDATQGMTMLIPPAWENDPAVDESTRAMFEYQSHLVEPWDGPALVAFADGHYVGAALDRNGLRPARLLLTRDLAIVASEAGVLDVDEREVVRRGRLGPGEIVAVDLVAGKFVENIRPRLAAKHPYAEWVERRASPRGDSEAGDGRRSTHLLRAFGYTRDEQQYVLRPMFDDAAEPIGSMGDDTPLAIFSKRRPLLFSYFKQRFAQVTNPPIDPYRESMVMSLETCLGPAGDLLIDAPLRAPVMCLPDPLLDSPDVPGHRLPLLFQEDLEAALARLMADAAAAVRDGAACLILSDRDLDDVHAAIPSLLATSAVHQHLVREGLRMQTSIVVDTGEARDDHQIAALIAFGADAVCPWLALTLAETDEARVRYHRAICKGLLKIMSKMGVSTMRSYRGSQLFEAIGISDDVIDRYFTGTPSPIGGIGLQEIERDTLARHEAAFSSDAPLQDAGVFRYRQNGEAHAYEPKVVKLLRAADYETYSNTVHGRDPIVLRDLLEFRRAAEDGGITPEPTSEIVRRFMTAAMSLGALSPEVQHVLAEAMNRMGGRSNCGEGGEPSEHFRRDTHRNHRVKQVASARFGVTAEYLVAAEELQIKIAQGSKPGEGGQLPGHKVTPEIARVRRATPGTTLISPPPHHDIYSIEDLAQLIFDLKEVNPSATVSVKLVSSAGIGTIAVGIAKAGADAIEVSGHDGGTGASPLGSIKNAGTPWEIGLSEVHQALTIAGLRGRVRLQVNGGLKTGRDVVMAALMGADEFGFGTAALVAAGCVMARQCHLNTCPAGIATQREDLRAKFKGTAENVIRFFTAIAEEVQEILGLLGYRTIAEIVGRCDLLRVSGESPLRLERLLWQPRDSGFGIRDSVSASRPESRAPNPESRSLGSRLAGNLVRKRGGSVRRKFRGAAGQSFGAFSVEGMHLTLEGEANDYVGKGMSGGEIIVRPHGSSRLRDQVIAGNTLLYGATGGRAFIAGRAGERFAVRNSGALAVVEGTGDHACEYMTGGVAVILGSAGRNLGAGMSGGIAFTLDAQRINGEYVIADGDLSHIEEAWLQQLLALHLTKTGSALAKRLLAEWSATRVRLHRVLPRSTATVPQILPMLAAIETSRPDSRERPARSRRAYS
ncbi:MAG TPA: glutamate synthase large subunit [Thermoanaerobaculia bacterium]|nr:glutamate synthase large subunit [Thermoanaerobaculia bacterium]